MDNIEEKLLAMGHRFRTKPSGAIIEPGKVVGDLVFLSGQGPQDEDGQLRYVGRVGADLTVDEGMRAAERVAVNCLGALKGLIGDLNRIEEVVKVLGFVNSDPAFHRQHEVMNGFTKLLHEVLGHKGKHARSAIGTNNLPNNQAVEVEMIVRIRT